LSGRGKDNFTRKKPLPGRPKDGHALFKGVYLQYFIENNFGTLITGRLIRDGCSIGDCLTGVYFK